MTNRRYDLDWLRIIAFGLLIFYHCGMFYVSWSWHVKSRFASDAMEPLMMLTNPWRLTLLFVIAGAATRFMADKMTLTSFIALRMRRLWPPLLLAMFVIVPPQSYFEIVEALQAAQGLPAGHGGWLDDFYIKYVTGTGNWCDADGCLITPTYNHMWFVAYLILYTLALVLILPLLRRVPSAASALIAGPLLTIGPWLYMAALRLTLFPIFGESHDFRDDWYLHALYFGMFLFGFAIAKHQPFFDRCVRLRWIALAVSLSCWAALVSYFSSYSDLQPPPEWLQLTMRGVRELDAWCAIVAAIGLAHRYLRGIDGRWRPILTQAVFPFYLIHQTIIVVAGHYLDELRLPLAIEAPLLIVITMAGCWLFFDLGRRMPVLRVWIGLSPRQPGTDKAG
ncbi:acyltransferase family protein [Parasphingorhabdus sp.]|uniref:acyltransferase family protein n=1 Tax=Parasphingorhabdus sp. TaxID=2709688 RepID=UPI003A937755